MLKFILQKLLGYRRYLLIFAKFKVATLRIDGNEKDFFAFMKLLKQDGRPILDVGANIGIMTAHLSTTFPKSKIFAVEPMPDNSAVLKSVLSKASNVVFHDVAVGNEKGSATMILPVNGATKMQGLSHIKTESITEWNEGAEVKVPLEKLDDLFGNENIQGVKMDVENFEYQALLGAEKIFTQNRPILYVELWDNENRKHCFELMSSWGYQAFVVDSKSLVPYNSEIHTQQNFIFQPN